MDIGSGNATVSYDDHRADVTIARPEKRNALDLQTLTDLTAAVETVADTDRDVRAMTLLGEGGLFSAGMDLELMAEADVDGHEDIYEGLAGLCNTLEAVPVPTVVGIEGAAIAGAFELTLPADFRVIGEDAVYGLKETKLGIFPFCGGTQRLPRLVGLGHAKDLVMRSDAIDPERAERIGLVNEVVAPDAVADRTRDLADELATRAPLGMERAKKCLNASLDVDLEAGLAMEYEGSKELWPTHDREEGFRSMLADRDPEYEGR